MFDWRGWRLATATASLLLGPAGIGQAQLQFEPIVVRGERPLPSWIWPGDSGLAPTADAAALMSAAPGGSVANNGPLSSQAQYRGLFGARLNVQVDGMAMTPGGPNWMDPPLHYLPQGQLDSLEVVRGIAPVSSGVQTLGGTIRAQSRKSRFTEDAAFSTSGRVKGSARSVNDGLSEALFAEIANRHHRLHVAAARDTGDDTEFGLGSIAATEFERDQYRLGYGFRGGLGELGLDVSYTETRDSGNPSLPLDIKFFYTEIGRLNYARDFSGVRLNAVLGLQSVDHEMTNFRLRPTPDFNPMMPGPDRRLVEATGDSISGGIDVAFARWAGDLRIGLNGYHSRHEQDIFAPDAPAFFVTQFNDATVERLSGFAEWSGALGTRVDGELGLRVTRVETDAGPVDLAPGLPPPAQNLRTAFNARDRDRDDTNIDAVATLSYALTEATRLQLQIGRKTRSPSHIERYLWLPLEVSAGLADANNYVGNPTLEPEVSHEINLGADWSMGGSYLQPQIYLRDLSDFIAGVAVDDTPEAVDSDVERVSNLNGDPTPLRFGNVDAQMIGFDLAWGVRLTGHWRIDGVLSIVRGERDSGDDLFRLPADRAIAAVSYARSTWSVRAEAELVAEQARISKTLVESEDFTTNDATPSYGLFHLGATYAPRPWIAVGAGVDNVFDKDHAVHTNGFNRVAGSDVALGERLPGPGRNVFVELELSM